jgi:hypothetical protein
MINLGKILDFEKDMKSRWASTQDGVIPMLEASHIKAHEHKGKDFDCAVCYVKSLSIGLYWHKNLKPFSSHVISTEKITDIDFYKNLYGSISPSFEDFEKMSLPTRLELECHACFCRVSYGDQLHALRFGPIRAIQLYLGLDPLISGISIPLGKIM